MHSHLKNGMEIQGLDLDLDQKDTAFRPVKVSLLRMVGIDQQNIFLIFI